MMKKEYVEPKTRMLVLDQENLMDFDVSPGEAGGDFDFAKEGNTFEETSLPEVKSVWDEEFKY